MAKIKVKFRPSTKEGQVGAICYQIIHNRVKRQIKTDYKLLTREWNEKESMVIILLLPSLFLNGFSKHIRNISR